MDHSLSNTFEIHQGLPQGAPESPTLFTIFINDLIERLGERGCGVRFAATRRPGLFFADDMALVASTTHELEISLGVASQWCREWRLEVNGSKSGILSVGTRAFKPGCSERMHQCCGETLKVVDHYRYLGVTFSDNLSFDRHVENAVSTARKASGRLNCCFSRGMGIGPGTRVHLWNTLVRPPLDCSMGVICPVSPQHAKDKMQAVQTEFLRKTLNAPKSCPPSVLLLEMGQEDLRARWDKSTLSLLSRMRQLPDGSLNKDTLTQASELAQIVPMGWGDSVGRIMHRVLDAPLRERGMTILQNLDSAGLVTGSRWTRTQIAECAG